MKCRWSSNPGLAFEGVVFTNRGFDIDELLPEEDFMESIRNPTRDDKGWPIYVNLDNLLYLPDKAEEVPLDSITGIDTGYKRRMKGIEEFIANQTIPPNMIFRVIEDEYSIIGVEDYGRLWFLDLVGEYQYEPAFEAVRQVMMSDPEFEMRESAIRCISKLDGPRVAVALSEKIADYNEHYMIREEAVKAIANHPLPSNIVNLRNAYDDSLTNSEIKSRQSLEFQKVEGGWLPNYCLRAMGRISTLDALDAIEFAIPNPDSGISYNAMLALDTWVEHTGRKLFAGVFRDESDQRAQLLKQLIYKYDLDSRRDMYSRVR